MDSSGKPELQNFTFNQKDLAGGGKQISLIARSEKEARRSLEDLKQKYSGIDVEKTLAEAKRVSEKFTAPIAFPAKLTFPEIFRSLFKTALDFYVLKGGDRAIAKKLSPVVDGVGNLHDSIFWSLQLEPFPGYKGTVTHTIALVGSSTEHLLYAQVTIFGCIRILALLDDNYSGPDLAVGHIENPLGVDPTPNDIRPVTFTRAQIDTIKTSWPTEASIQANFAELSKIAQKRMNENASMERGREALFAKLASISEGRPPTAEDINEAINAFREAYLGENEFEEPPPTKVS